MSLTSASKEIVRIARLTLAEIEWDITYARRRLEDSQQTDIPSPTIERRLTLLLAVRWYKFGGDKPW